MALLEAGTTAPEVRGENLTGGPVQLADFKDRRAVALLFSPATVDPSQINATNSLHKELQDSVAIVVVQRKVPSKQMATMFLKQMGVQFPVILDESGASLEAYGVEKPPAAFYINSQGEIVGSSAIADLKQIKREIEDCLL
jgi:peroxiredoxin